MRRLVVLVAAVLVGLAPGGAAAQEAAADFEVPGGWFYAQALPGRADGVGFAVQDGHGAALWSALQELGGVLEVGYPISSRFEWEGRVAQAFQWGVLRWDGEAEQVEWLPLERLPGGRPPGYALKPDQPPMVAAELERTPWSGWWWPAWPGLGRTLFATGGPLEKYDRYVEQATGENPGTRDWERNTWYFPGSSWAGHCNGWAAAALLEAEPTEPREVDGITFSVGDLKGLLSAYHFADAAAWSYGEGGLVDPADFHRVLVRWMAGQEPRGFVLTFEPRGEEVWSYPVYRHETAWAPDPVAPGVWHVRATLWMANPNVAPDFVGLQEYPRPEGQVFEYVIEGDPRNPSGGAWVGASERGRFARPGRIWYPEPRVRNLGQQLASPGLDRAVIGRILGEE